MKTELFVLFLLVSIAIAGCNYVYTGSTTKCEPPAIAMSDINGNTVCVVSPGAQQANQTVQVVTSNATPEQNQPLEEVKTSAVVDNGSTMMPTEEEKAPEEAKTTTKEEQAPVQPEEANVTAPEENTQTQPEAENATEETTAPAQNVDTSSLPKKTVQAGELVNFPNLKATDPEGQPITYTFSSPLNSSGEWQTTEDDAGEYVVTITASDGVNDVSQDVLIIVKQANRPPVISALASVQATEGDLVSITPQVSDPDGDAVKVTFGEPLDNSGKWQTEEGDAGNYVVNVEASDGKLTSETTVMITVSAKNSAPVITNVTDMTVNEGDTVVLNPVVTDADGDRVNVSYSGWMTSKTYTTTYDDSGEHMVTISATDGKDTTDKGITITVKNVNRPPVFDPGAFS